MEIKSQYVRQTQTNILVLIELIISAFKAEKTTIKCRIYVSFSNILYQETAMLVLDKEMREF